MTFYYYFLFYLIAYIHYFAAELTNNILGKKQLIIVSGCTSVGKSAVANLLCNRIDSEIIIADR